MPRRCRCQTKELFTKGRCPKHGRMMLDIRRRGYNGTAKAFNDVGQEADGFGEPGYNIGDWSAWRDSTVEGVEYMHERAMRYPEPPRCGARNGRWSCVSEAGHPPSYHLQSNGIVWRME